MRALVLGAAAVLTLCLVGLTTAPCTHQPQSIDEIIGQGEFNTVHPVSPGTPEQVHRQISQRLVYLESLLRSRDVSSWPIELQHSRARTLDNLHEYRVNNTFTTNYDHPDKALPCFMDRDGNYCAVAWLVARSAGLPLAQKLNSRYQYATIVEMDSPELDKWIAHSGLTRAEVITIQVVEVRAVDEQPNVIANADTTGIRPGYRIRGGRTQTTAVQLEGINTSSTVSTLPVHADSTQSSAIPSGVLSDRGQR
jgi:hypothetical protein